MGWERALITDSGGFQVFSLAHGGVANEVKGSGRTGASSSEVELTEEGARFRSYRDGSRALHLARGLDAGAGGARLRHRPRLRRVHALPRRPRLHRALDRAHPPLARPLPRLARAARGRSARRVFGIVQGGVHEDLRRESAAGGLRGGGRRDRDRRHPRPRQGGDGRGAGDDRAAAARGGAQAPARDRRGRRPARRHRPRPRRLRLRRADPARPPRRRPRARPRAALAPRPAQGRLRGRPPAAGRGLPLPGLHAPRPRLHQLPLAGRGADRGAPARPPQPHLHARADRATPAPRSRPAASTPTAPPSSPGATPWDA